MATAKDFSVEEKLSTLIKLQKIDSKLSAIQILKGELPMEVSDLEDEVFGLTSRKIRIEEEINGINEFIEQKQIVQKEADALLKKYDKQSSAVRNSREYEAINKEIELQELEGKLAEKNVRDANEDLVEKARILETLRKQITSKETTLTHKKEELDKIVTETKKEEDQLLKIATDARKSIDERLLLSYDRIRNSYRNGLAVVPVDRDACGGCHNAIPPQKQSEIRLRKKVMVCENCGRILVDDDLNNGTDVK